MKAFFPFFIFGLIAVVLQSTWFSFGEVHLNFLLPAVVFLGFYGELKTGLGLALWFGWLLDSASFAPFGVFLWIYTLLFLSIHFFVSRWVSPSLLNRFSWLLAFSVAERLALMLLTPLFSPWVVSIERVFYFVLQTFLDAGLGLLLFPLFRQLSSIDTMVLFRPKGLTVK